MSPDAQAEAIASPPADSEASIRPGSLTKIIATLGPASSTTDVIDRLLEAGMRIVRFNFGHGTLADHAERLALVRERARIAGVEVLVFGDLQGPKIRVDGLGEGGVVLEAGHRLVVRRDESVPPSGAVCLDSTYPGLVDDVEPGHRLLIDDGRVRALVVEKEAGFVTARVTHGGRVLPRKGINLPDSIVTADPLTDEDWAHVQWAIENELDALALSFARRAEDIALLRREIARRVGDDYVMPIIAKVESPQGVANIGDITDAADAIMVARGDLGVEMDNAQVPVVQKRLLREAKLRGTPCIVATQMLESMIDQPTPTRAEASDVAGAIYDGVDAVMLSGETAVGAHPSVAVEQMRRIASYTERDVADSPRGEPLTATNVARLSHTAALAHGVWTIAGDCDPKWVVVWSETGFTARHLSQNKLSVPILAYTSDQRTMSGAGLLLFRLRRGRRDCRP